MPLRMLDDMRKDMRELARTSMRTTTDTRNDRYIVKHDGGRWWDFPYSVNRGGEYVGSAMFLWSAKWVIRQDRAKRRRGSRTWIL